MASSISPETPAARRRALSRQARDAFPPMGVYAIRNLATGQVQVAASRNVPGAINRAKFELQWGRHRDVALQRAWSAQGEQGVRFEVLEMVRERDDAAFDEAAELDTLLQLWSEELGTSGASR